jgi:hypothetical protein
MTSPSGLTDRRGTGPVGAAQVVVSFSHASRVPRPVVVHAESAFHRDRASTPVDVVVASAAAERIVDDVEPRTVRLPAHRLC